MAIVPATQQEVDAFKQCKVQSDLATLLGVSEKRLVFHLYSPHAPKYREFDIPKANGGSRSISVPPKLILSLQRRLNRLLVAMYEPKDFVHSFVSSRSIVSNADEHLRRAAVLNIDLKDFFPSIHYGRVRGVFARHPFAFSDEIASTLAQLCCVNGVLPQGAATSPVLSNFVCRKLDVDLDKLCKKHKCTFTRYADDITISTKLGPFPEQVVVDYNLYGREVKLGNELIAIVQKHDFSINEGKTRVQQRWRRQEVTGLIVNKRINVRRKFVKRVRALINGWRAKGEAAATAKFHSLDPTRKTRSGNAPKLSDHLAGCLEYLRMVRGKGDLLFTRYAIEAARLDGYSRTPFVEAEAATVPAFVRESMWVVIGRDSSKSVVAEGTAFCLEERGWVTAQHVFTDPAVPVHEWSAVRASKPFDEYVIKEYRSDPHVDLAIFHVPAKRFAKLRAGESAKLAVGSGVRVVGFPTWNTFGDEPMNAVLAVSQKKPISGLQHFSVNMNLLGGTSGGPAIDEFGHVVGVVITSSGHALMPNACLTIENVAHAEAGAISKLS